MSGIIVGIDGSDHSRKALEWAVGEAAVRHAPLTVLAVHQAVAGVWGGGPVAYPGDPELIRRLQDCAQQETDGVLEKFGAGARPASVTVRSVNGMAAEEILRAGADADMIVVGSRGAGGFRRLLMGSVAAQVTHHARCPVVVIPAEEH